MWMVECNDHGNKEMKMASVDPGSGRKLRPLMPRPIGSCSNKSNTFSSISSSSCCCCIHNPNVLSWNHPLIGGASSDYGVRRDTDVMTNMPLVSTRWNPTPEQLQGLEELYRRGTRTPSAEQIQQIAAKLRKFGKIEGKNVFYWFQNHKARERQKKRRQLELQAGKKLRDFETTERKSTGLNKRYLQIEQPKKLSTLSNCPKTPSEDSASMHGSVVAECKRDGWRQLNQKECQLEMQIITTKNEWELDLSCSNADNINYSSQENIDELNLMKRLLPPKNEILENGMVRENQTLELFPIKRIDDLVLRATANPIDATNEETQYKFTPTEFIEFLPTKI